MPEGNISPMSLRSFHIVFILTALALCGFLGYWSGSHILHNMHHHHSGHNTSGFLPLLVTAATAFLTVGSYLVWFLRKTRKQT